MFVVPKEYVELSVIIIRYFEDESRDSEDTPSEENKKERSRERTIREVVELVQRWR